MKDHRDHRDSEPLTATDPAAAPATPAGLQPEHFIFIGPQNKLLCVPTKEMWERSAVDAIFGEGTAAGIASTRSTQQISWVPGRDLIVTDSAISEGGIFPQPGFNIANTYMGPQRPQRPTGGDPEDIGRWQGHLMHLYPETCDHIERWFAHRVQRPWQKVNHALVLGGKQGIGKDTLLDPLKVAVGAWNVHEIHPENLLEPFNPYLKSIVLRVSEARDLGGEMTRFELYERTKVIITSPPETLRVNEKNVKQYHIPNVTGVIFTTNHRDGLWLPADDRRHHVSWADQTSKEMFTPEYWDSFYDWFDQGGRANVIAYLEQLDLSDFDPMNPPPQTDAWRAMVGAGCSSEESELQGIVDAIGKPVVLSLETVLTQAARTDLWAWLTDRRNRRRIPHLFDEVGYIPVSNKASKDGYWQHGDRRVALYGLEAATEHERQQAATVYLSKRPR